MQADTAPCRPASAASSVYAPTAWTFTCCTGVGSIGLDETMEALALLQRQGKIRRYGVSNLDRSDMEELWQTKSGPAVVTNQVLYNLMRRGIEWDLLPWLRKRRIPVMAYSPLEQGRL